MEFSRLTTKSGLAALCTAWVTLAPISHASAQGRSPAVVLFDEGRALAEVGQQAEACKKFEESNRLDDQNVGTLLNLGLCNEKQQKWQTALRWYRASLERAQRSKEQIQIDAASGKITELTDLVPIINIQFTAVPPEGTTVLVDGVAIDRVKWPQIEVDNGSHRVEVQAPGMDPFKETVEMNTKSKHTTTVVLAAKVTESMPSNWKRNAFIFGGIGAGMVIASPISAKLLCGSSDRKACTSGSDNLIKFGSNGLWIGGAAMIGVGVYYYFYAPKMTAGGTAMVPTVGNDGLGLAIIGGF
ncbi:MAG: tetratricopeptide repeat protein [Kofleriaceae bacterium]|nr:tetratricopeptide repeat protein [Kofleriaceae bacterium]